MPPESSPWSRKNFIRERKNEDAVTAWKDPFQKSGLAVLPRVSRSDDGLRAPVLSRQRNSRLFPEESDYSGGSRPATDPRLLDGMIEDVNCHPSSHRWWEGKVSRTVRDKSSDTALSKGFTREWKGYQSDGGDAYLGSPTGRPMGDERYTSHHHHSHSAAGSSFYGHLIESQNNKMGSDGLQSRSWERGMDVGMDRPSVTQGGYSQENALDTIRWKPLKWARSSSISSLGSVLSHSSRGKSGKSEVEDGKVTSLHVPPGKSVTVDTPVASGDSSPTRKKQRLGWGQGLAKYEKEKVEGHEDAYCKNDLSLQGSDLKRIDSPLPGVPENDQLMATVATCGSPMAASLGAFSLSPDVKDKDSLIHVSYAGDLYPLGPTDRGCDFAAEDFIMNLDSLDINAIDSLIADLVHNEDSFADSSSFPGYAYEYKIASLKKCIMKLLEKKEGEIDQSENELRVLCSETEDIIAREKVINADDTAVESTRQNINESEKLPGSTPPVVSLQPGSAVPFDAQFHQVARSVGPHQACDVQLAASSNVDIDLVKVAHGETLNEPYCVDKGCGAITPDQKRNNSTMDLSNKNESTFSYLTNLVSYVDIDDSLISSVLALNNKLAREGAAEIFKYIPVPANALQELPTGSQDSMLPAVRTCTDVQATFVRRKCRIKFKERSLVLKFKALRHLWKEDVRLLCRKHRTRQQKRLESSSRIFRNASPKHGSSISSRFTLTGKLTLVPTKEVVSFAGKLLSSPAKFHRYNLKMPSMLLDESDRNFSRFLSWNGLIEDPCNAEKERNTINPWTTEEKEIFMEYFAAHGKDFSKIASHLQHKTTADCVEFYYKNHKTDVFKEVKKAREKSKESVAAAPTAYLVTGGNNWIHKRPASSLDVLGEASVAASRVHENQNDPASNMDCFSIEVSSEMGDGSPESIVDIRTVENNTDARASAVDMIAGVCGALSSEAVSSCVTSSIDPGDGPNEWKYLKMDHDIEVPFTPDALQNVDEDTCSDESSGGVAFSDWSDVEKAIFITALRSYGKDFATISRCVGSRSMDQCKIFFSKARKCLALDVIHMVSGNEGTPVSDAHGGHSDTEDACAVETDSAFCTAGNSCKMETDSSLVGFGCSLASSNDDYGYPGSNSLHLKGSVAADREAKFTGSGKELPSKNEDCPADSLVPISSLDHSDTLMNTEKVEGNGPALSHGKGPSPLDVSNQKCDDSDPDACAKGPNPHLLASHVGIICGTRERLDHAYERASVPTQDSVDSDARSPGILGGSHAMQKPEFALRKLPLTQTIEGVSSVSVVGPSAEGRGICSEQPGSSTSVVVSRTKSGALCSERQNSSAAMVVPSTKGAANDVASAQQVDLDNQKDGLLNHLELQESSMIQVEETSAAVTSSVSSYNSLVLDGHLMSVKALACGNKLPVSWQRENCQFNPLNGSREIERENLIDASSSSHRDATSTLDTQMAYSSSIDARDNLVHGSESVKCSRTKSDSYRECIPAGKPSTEVDLPAQTFKSFLLQAADGGSDNSVFVKHQSLHHSMDGKKSHDLRGHLKMQGNLFSQENANGHHNTLNYSLFLPRMDCMGSSGEPVPSSPFESSCGSTKHIFMNQPENEPEVAKRGEVKLFGRSLVVHPPLSKIDRHGHAVQNQHPLQERNSSASGGLNLADHQVSTAEAPRTSCGYWDGTRIQTGYQALPDSGFLVSNSSRGSNGLPDSGNRMIDQRMVSDGKDDGCVFYRSREVVGARRIGDYHIYSSEPVQPFSSRPLSVVSDLHKRNPVTEMTSQAALGLQNHGMGASAASSVNCVSDPAVALKMQFADNFCKQKGALREDDSWRGDINR